jgi:hypothetical protein
VPVPPGLVHTAALIGTGSEVLGFDTQRSIDHDWGPRLYLFPAADDLAEHGPRISALLAKRLPATVAAYSTNLLRHGIVVGELGEWLTGHLGFNPLRGITTLECLATPTQALADVTTGAVRHDGLDHLHPVRGALSWYPDGGWRDSRPPSFEVLVRCCSTFRS